MNKEEIKELLDKLDLEEWSTDLYKVPLSWCELYDIRDYINLLQQENKQLKEQVAYLKRSNNRREDEIMSLREELIPTIKEKELKERIDKAIEYIKNNGEKQYNIHGNYRGKWYSPDDLDNLLDILEGNNDSKRNV